MPFIRALVFSNLLASILLVSCCRAATNSFVECDTRRAACEASYQAEDAVSDFECDEQNGAISSSCACASPASSSREVATTQPLQREQEQILIHSPFANKRLYYAKQVAQKVL
jgi:hypothetical protein